MSDRAEALAVLEAQLEKRRGVSWADAAARLEPMRKCRGILGFLGFYSGVEIAPFDDRARALDWTGVLVTAGSSS